MYLIEEKLNAENPLTKYKRANPYVSWDDISNVIGLGRVTLIRLAKRDRQQILNTVLLKHYELFKQKLNIDLLNDYGIKEEPFPAPEPTDRASVQAAVGPDSSGHDQEPGPDNS